MRHGDVQPFLEEIGNPVDQKRAHADLGMPGVRTGRYRVGGERLLTDDSGESHISVEDYAVAMLDEVEQPRHRQARFSVAF